jgi:cytochrome c biogenesis DsbD-like protein
LKIDKGYHVNANPASLDYLILTAVSFEYLSPIDVRYPKPLAYTPSFARRAHNIYDGIVNITATFPEGSIRRAGTLRGKVRVQACTDQICLPPADLPIETSLGSRSP